MSFSEGLDLCLRKSFPLVILILSFFALSLSRSTSSASKVTTGRGFYWGNATESPIDFAKNDVLLGSQDPFFWFLVPLFGLVSVGACVIVNYVALGVIHVLSIVYTILTAQRGWMSHEDRR